VTRRATLDGELEAVSFRDLFVILRSGITSITNRTAVEAKPA